MEEVRVVKEERFLKQYGKWLKCFETTNEVEVYKDVTDYFICKYINKVNWIVRMQRKNLFDGFQKITFWQNDSVKVEFTIKNKY